MKKVIKIVIKIILTVICLALIIVLALEFSPIYRFAGPEPFSGEKIYNPYADLDTTLGWSRSNFHTHTHATKWINECELYPDKVLEFYDHYGYDIVSFSNHMELTKFPGDTARQIWVYEHGYNIFKFHQLVFNPSSVNYFDIVIPFLPSQKQFLYDILGKDSDFLVMNHPDRTNNMTSKTMRSLTGYRLMEADAGAGTDLHRWDEALSAGRYSFCLINDDLHKPRISDKIARRCSWLNTPSRSYSDVRETLLKGNFYSMRIPDFGDGDLDVKLAGNNNLPRVREIGMRGDTIFFHLSADAESIEVITQDGIIPFSVADTCAVSYVMQDSEPYIRMTARFDDGVVIYTNPFARYSVGNSPYKEFPHPIRWGATILYNISVLALIYMLFAFILKYLKKR